ncbi:MAG: hypothetical protein UW86_C0005G0006 [Microgenomates group bacterium GW2011_GWA1_Microgenomates_45_10]|nr:MAG: hypothetical protein UW69_C0005G0006 [Microgenomates group bacterium GW2011_GWA2_44_7]KKT77596.1 MAG: hypothetical protein UW73_C0016G0006 [Microgenomates group bacterium GW2011_GWB1_44_8]KKT87265.1 MAG: hypothetical protein UW86_C0005G0006 [Microgenomates group bacterium GW2011_GWA1_Microgenomates_45_10]
MADYGLSVAFSKDLCYITSQMSADRQLRGMTPEDLQRFAVVLDVAAPVMSALEKRQKILQDFADWGIRGLTGPFIDRGLWSDTLSRIAKNGHGSLSNRERLVELLTSADMVGQFILHLRTRTLDLYSAKEPGRKCGELQEKLVTFQWAATEAAEAFVLEVAEGYVAKLTAPKRTWSRKQPGFLLGALFFTVTKAKTWGELGTAVLSSGLVERLDRLENKSAASPEIEVVRRYKIALGLITNLQLTEFANDFRGIS